MSNALEGKNADVKLGNMWRVLVAKREAMEQGKSGSTSEEPPSSSVSMEPEKREWPSYDAVIAGIIAADYNQTLKCPFDFLKREEGVKTISPHGVVCQARLELFETNNLPGSYTGLLAPGSKWNHCLLRLSSAMQPPNQALKSSIAKSILYTAGDKLRNAQLFPLSALKVFTDGDAPTKNLLFGGSKIGQRETDYFAHCQATTMTERMPLAVKPFVRKFWEYSKWPLSLGVSDFCKPLSASDDDDGNGNNSSELNFPFAVILKPCIRASPPCEDDPDMMDDGGSDDEGLAGGKPPPCSDANIDGEASASGSGKGRWSRWTSSLSSFSSSKRGSSNVSSITEETGSFDSFLDFSLNQIPAETHLFDVYACPTPQAVADASQLQRIGRVVTTSTFIQSSPDDGLFFKHQAKEEDYSLRPNWPEALQEQVSLDQGKVKGPVGTLAGWKLFEQQIAKDEYVDYEKVSS